VGVTPRRILVVTRDGTLGGDQLYLLHLLRWLADATDTAVDVLSWHEGPLTDDLREVSDLRTMDELDQWRPARAFEVLRVRRAAQVLKGARLRWWLRRRRSVDVIYVNGLEAARIVGYLPRSHPPVVVHVHGLAEVESSPLSDVDRAAVLDRARAFVAASDEVAAALVALGVAPDRIHRHDHFVGGADQLPASIERPTRAQLGLGDGELVVGGIGTADWWAAADQFVLVAWALRTRRPDLPLRFVWIAGDDDPKVLWPLRHDLANAGVDDITVVTEGRRPLDYLAVMDALVLSTRVESQELVALEAAAGGVVVVATDNVARHTAVDDLAVVVPYLDLDALVGAILAVMDDPEARAEQVARGRAVALDRHDVTVGGPALLDLLAAVA
jgi:glycosyltransferase involved in cell wall biosynthesis